MIITSKNIFIMHFNYKLTDGILLKRILNFLLEISVKNSKPIIIGSPNLNKLANCNILGTRIWYSKPNSFNYLPNWEIAEVDNQHLVCVNPKVIKPIFYEALISNTITELNDYRPYHIPTSYEQAQSSVILLKNNSKLCYVGLEHVTLANINGEAFFPENKNQGFATLNRLIELNKNNYRSILLFCVTHTGANCLKLEVEYQKLLSKAIKQGVEVVAYKSSIDLERINLSSSLAIINSNQKPILL